MGPIAAGAVGAGLSILGGISANKAITRQANENFNNTLTVLDLQRSLNFNELQQQGQEVNNQIGLELTNLAYEERKAKASTVVQSTERNIYGATALKLASQVEMDSALMADNIVQSGESAMQNVQKGLSSAMYEYNTGVYQASQNRASALNQRKGTFELLTGAASTGMSFSSGYNSMTG